MKKILSVFIAAVMIFSALSIAISAVENEVTVTLNGHRVVFDVPARIIGDRTMVPVRQLLEALGATIEWNGELREVITTRGEDTLKFRIGEPELYKNGELIYNFDTLPVIIEENGESRTLIPLRAVSEAFGYTVEWEVSTRSAMVYDFSNVYFDNVENKPLMLGGFPVDNDVYEYFVMNVQAMLAGSLQGYDEATASILVASAVYESMLTYYATFNVASMMGLSIYDFEAKEAIDTTLSTYKQYYGESFYDILASSYMTEDVFKSLLYTQYLNEKILDLMVKGADELTVDEKVNELLDGGQMIRAYHILTPELETAEGILEAAKTASDEEFYDLIQEHGRDTGMVGNTDGYYFSAGQMVVEFEDAAFALEIGQTSEIVETEYGYHIIRRLPMEKAYVEAHIDELYQIKLNTDLNELIRSNAMFIGGLVEAPEEEAGEAETEVTEDIDAPAKEITE